LPVPLAPEVMVSQLESLDAIQPHVLAVVTLTEPGPPVPYTGVAGLDTE
jgi:hypothetical protein